MKRLPLGAWLTFALAVIVAIAWGAIEISLRVGHVPEPAANALCRPLSFPVPPLPAARLLSVQGREFRVYDEARERLVLYELTDAPGAQALREGAAIPLRCSVPGYHCFPAGADGPEKLSVRMADDRHGVIRAGAGSREIDFPFEWGARGFRLGNPVKFCDAPLSNERNQLAWASSRLIAVDREGRRLGLFSISDFKGALWREAAREPDQSWGFTENFSFKEAGCGDDSAKARLNLGTFNGLLWFLKDDPSGSDFTMYNLDAGLQPVEAPELRGPWRRVHALDANALLFEGVGRQEWLRALWREAGPRLDRLPASSFPEDGRASFRSGPEDSLLRASSARWLSAPRLGLIDAQDERPIAAGPTALSAETPAEWGLAPLNAREFVWIFQAGDRVEFQKVECGKGLTAPSK